MMYKSFILSVILTVLCGVVLGNQGQDHNNSLCYQFTWLGPRFNNDSIFLNATCQDATRLSNGVPCQLPLVVSYDGSWPDTEYIWTHHAQDASCVLAENDVCAKYTYYFNDQVENSTYMCTRAIDFNNTAITSGCYEETRGSYMTRVCLCRTIPGGVPCNSASVLAILPMISFILAIVIIMKNQSISINGLF